MIQSKHIAMSERITLRLSEAVAYSGLSRATINRFIASGRLTSRKVGRSRMIDRRSVDVLLTGRAA